MRHVKFFLLSIFILYKFISFSQPEKESFFDLTDRFLSKNVVYGMIDYQALKFNPGMLDALVQYIGNTDLKDSTEASKTAFYINAYNLLVIKQVTNQYPISSPMDVNGFF